MERKTQLRPADSSQNLPLQSYNAGFKWIWQPKNETLVRAAARKYVFGGAIQYFAGQRYTLSKTQNASNF
jgi:hypothetical protein